MPTDTDSIPFPTDSTEPDTRASTDGELPFPIAVFLTLIALPVVLTFSGQMGSPAPHIAVLFGTGILAAGSIHLATTNTGVGYTIVGVAFLWVSATIFAVTTIALITAQNNVTNSIIVTLLIAGAVLLTPFGLIGSSVRTFGHGAAQTVLSRYLLGTLVLAVIILVLVLQGSVRSMAAETVSVFYTSVTGMAFSDASLYLRGFLSVFLYAITAYLVQRAIHTAPIDVFIPAAKADQAPRIREKTDTAYHYTLVLTGLYFITVATTTVMAQVSDSDLVTVFTFITQIGSSTPLILGVIIVLFASLGMILITSAVHRIPNITGSEMVEVLTPPVTITAIIFLFTAITEDAVSSYILETSIGGEITPDGLLHQLITGQPSVVLLGLFATTLLLSGVVLSIPSFIAGVKIGDESFTGIIATILSLSVLIILSVIAQSHSFLIIAGVVLIAVIWEVGEHTTVAVGEMKSKTQENTLPSGFYSLIAVHIAAIIGVAIIAYLTGIAALLVFTTPNIPASLAGVALVFCTIAFAAFIKLLPG